MFIIGERVNSSRKSVEKAIQEKASDFILAEATAQCKAGARMLDVNCGIFPVDEEPELMKWLIRSIQGTLDVPLCIDSANAKTLEAGLAVHKGKAMVNSISHEKDRYQSILPLVKEHGSSVVALCQDERGIPSSNEAAGEVARGLIGDLLDAGVAKDDIYLDPLVRSIATSPEAVLRNLSLIRDLAHEFEGIHFVSGLSNVSYGLPERRHLNRAYVVLSMASGLDTVILDPLDEAMIGLIHAGEALLNRDRYCLRYIEAFHQGLLKN